MGIKVQAQGLVLPSALLQAALFLAPEILWRKTLGRALTYVAELLPVPSSPRHCFSSRRHPGGGSRKTRPSRSSSATRDTGSQKVTCQTSHCYKEHSRESPSTQKPEVGRALEHRDLSPPG